MKLNKSYIKQLISEQLQEELKSPLQKGADAVAPKDLPGFVAGLIGNAAAQEAIAGLSQQTLMQVMQLAGQSQDPAAQQIVPLIQSALDGMGDAAQKAQSDATS
jgi:hypothetical protein|tara:strand:+ start:284 stop:595 length:312 start_codon:yes stop_codon:yes gene_type:complete